MPNIFVGDVHPPSGNPDDVFTVTSLVPGEQAAGSVADTGCKMVHPRLTPAACNQPTGGGRCCNSCLFNVTNGLIIGAFYVLMAFGLSLILNLSNVINFAHGNFLALGGYIAFVLTPYIGFWGRAGGLSLLTARARLSDRATDDPPGLHARSGL